MYKNKNKKKQALRDWRDKNPEKVKASRKRTWQKHREKISVKRSKRIQQYKDIRYATCAMCGYNKNYAALQWHHMNKDKKEINLSRCQSVLRAFKEIKHCILLCANCHAEIHNPHLKI